MNVKVDSKMYSPRVGSIFYVVRKNGHVTPYLIISLKDGKYGLANMYSGQVNYTGDSIENLIKNYLNIQKENESKAKLKINPITHYFFANSNDTTITSSFVFGHTSV